jgi:hypothetical protein
MEAGGDSAARTSRPGSATAQRSSHPGMAAGQAAKALALLPAGGKQTRVVAALKRRCEKKRSQSAIPLSPSGAGSHCDGKDQLLQRRGDGPSVVPRHAGSQRTGRKPGEKCARPSGTRRRELATIGAQSFHFRSPFLVYFPRCNRYFFAVKSGCRFGLRVARAVAVRTLVRLDLTTVTPLLASTDLKPAVYTESRSRMLFASLAPYAGCSA